MYDVILFDLDGTLTDPKEGLVKSFRYAMSALGINKEPDDPARLIGPPLRETFKLLYGFSPPEIEQAVAKFREYFAETGLFENAVYSGIPELLRGLRDRGKTLAVATSKVTLYTRRILQHFDLDGYFAFVSGDEPDGSLTKNGKAEIIRAALDGLGVTDKHAAVMVGDRKHDILGAKEAGVDSIGVLYGYGSREELTEAGAERIAEDVKGLTEFLY